MTDKPGSRIVLDMYDTDDITTTAHDRTVWYDGALDTTDTDEDYGFDDRCPFDED